MTVLLVLFLTTAALLWLSVFGYLLLLASIASRRRHGERGEPTWPASALAEEHLHWRGGGHGAARQCAGGYHTRICRTAIATEIRVPQRSMELVRFRRRRGAAYVSELRSSQYSQTPASWRLARLMRLWHFLVAPKVGVGLAVAAGVLLATPHWPWPLLVFAGFALPALAVLFALAPLEGPRHPWWRVPLVASRWSVLTLVSMLTLRSHPAGQSAVGGRS